MIDIILHFFRNIIPKKWYWVFEHGGFKKYFFNTGWLLLGRIFSLGISFLIGVYIARYLGPAHYGLFSYVISFVGLFAFLTSFGIDGIVNREIIKNPDNTNEITGTAFYIKIIGSLLAIFSVFVVSFFTVKDPFTLLLICLFSFSFIPQAFNVIEIYFKSQVLAKKIATAQILASIISTLLKILCIVLGKGIFWLVIIFVIEAFIYASISIFLFTKIGNHLKKWKFNFSRAKLILKDSWPLMFAIIAVGVYMKIDQVMIKNILGNEQAGIYAVAVKLSELWYFVPTLICASVFPALTKAMNISKDFFENRIKKLYFLMFWLSFFIALVTTFFAHWIIKIIFGIPYLGATGTVQIYVWAGISVSLGIVIGQYWLVNNFTKIYFYTTLMGAIVNIAINIILIPRMGINGAAIATLISYTVVVFGLFVFKKTRNHGFLMLKSITGYK